MLKYKFIFFILLFIQGCATFEYPITRDIQKSAIDDGNSVVIISTWAHDKSISFGTDLTLYSKEENKTVHKLPIDNYVLKPHFNNGWGYLHILHMKPGEYELGMLSTNLYDKYERIDGQLPLVLTVEKNEVLYAGEVYLYHGDGTKFIEIRGARSRDISIFLKNNDAFKPEDITIRLPKKYRE